MEYSTEREILSLRHVSVAIQTTLFALSKTPDPRSIQQIFRAHAPSVTATRHTWHNITYRLTSTLTTNRAFTVSPFCRIQISARLHAIHVTAITVLYLQVCLQSRRSAAPVTRQMQICSIRASIKRPSRERIYQAAWSVTATTWSDCLPTNDKDSTSNAIAANATRTAHPIQPPVQYWPFAPRLIV